MNTAKHTPGPWALSTGRVITTSSGQFYLAYGKDKYGNPLFKNFVELDNNAHLIAAAPAMYEALAEARDYIRRLYGSTENEAIDLLTNTAEDVEDRLTAALAQAEGR